jgi:hypothetical protein
LILSQADVVIPGHGREFQVTDTLLKNMIGNFANAEYAKDCPEVVEILSNRLS